MYGTKYDSIVNENVYQEMKKALLNDWRKLNVDEIGWDEIEAVEAIKAGDRVRKKNGEKFQNGETVVTVERIDGNVAWFEETGSNWFVSRIEKVYESESLKKVMTKKKGEVGQVPNEEEWLPDSFPFPGQRVMLNPDYKEKYKNHIENQAGYIINNLASENDIMTILTSGKRHMPDWQVKVRFDDALIVRVRVKHLLVIDAPIRKITRYSMSGTNNVVYMIEGVNEEEAKEAVDRLVFSVGKKISSIVTFDEAFKNERIAKAYQELSK